MTRLPPPRKLPPHSTAGSSAVVSPTRQPFGIVNALSQGVSPFSIHQPVSPFGTHQQPGRGPASAAALPEDGDSNDDELTGAVALLENVSDSAANLVGGKGEITPAEEEEGNYDDTCTVSVK